MKRLKKQIVGLTGSIGSGKSTVSARLGAFGARILDADAVSRALMEPGGRCYNEVLHIFGTRVICEDGALNRKALAEIIFNDANMRETLNGIVHPRVREQMLATAAQIAAENADVPVILDVPLLFECGMEHGVDETVFVYADDGVRLKRIVARDKCTREHALKRMASQMPQEQKRRLADVTIDNSGTLEQLYRQVDAWYHALLEEAI